MSYKTGRKPVFLIGFMASGKSTLGRALAATMPDITFIDLDTEVEQTLGMSASKAFSLGLVDKFRATEAEVLKKVCRKENVVVATGGGTPCFYDNMELMLLAGIVVRLECTMERLLNRIKIASTQRPLLAGLHGNDLEARVSVLMAEREAFYSRADAVFDATKLETEDEVAETTAKFIAKFMAKG